MDTHMPEGVSHKGQAPTMSSISTNHVQPLLHHPKNSEYMSASNIQRTDATFGTALRNINPDALDRHIPDIQNALSQNKANIEYTHPSGNCFSFPSPALNSFSLTDMNIVDENSVSHASKYQRNATSPFINCSKKSLNDLAPDLVRRLGSLPIIGFMVVDTNGSEGLVVGLPLSSFLVRAAKQGFSLEKHLRKDNLPMDCSDKEPPSVSHNSTLEDKKSSLIPTSSVKIENIDDDIAEKTQVDGVDHIGTLDDHSLASVTSNEVGVVQRMKNHICSVCDRAYYTRSHLKAHIRSQHTHEKPYVCDICGNSYSRSDSLSAHRRLHYGIKRYKCEYCGKGFGYHTHWKIHLRTHERRKPYKCESCQKSFSSEADYNCHTVQCKHPRLKCPECIFETVKALELRKHVKIHTKEKVRCQLCKKHFTNTRDLDKHKSMHWKAESLICSHCNVLFESKKKLLIHRRMYRIHGKKKYLCLDCGMKFSEFGHFKTHKVLKHKVQKKEIYHCQKCNSHFDTKILLSKHMRRDHYMERDPDNVHRTIALCCDICTYRCSSKMKFEKHFANFHSTFYPYKCKHCKERFLTHDRLIEHSVLHVGSFLRDTFPCNHCYDVFFAEESLRRHLSDNNVEVNSTSLGLTYRHPLEPNTMQLNASEPQGLYKDLAKKEPFAGGMLHQNMKRKVPYHCDLCGAELLSALHIKDHFIFKHNGINPYRCLMCQKRFVAPILRARHCVKAHPEEMLQRSILKGNSFIKTDEDLGNMSDTEQSYDDTMNDQEMNSLEDMGVEMDNEGEGRRIPKRKAAQQRSFSQYSFATIELDYDQDHFLNSMDQLQDSKKRSGVKPRAYTVVHCDLCNEVLVTAMKAKEHFIKFHSGIGPYKCEICDQRFQSLYIRKNHMLKHQDDTGGVRKRFQCDKCDKSFLKSYSLREHLLRHSQNEENQGEGGGGRVAFSPKRQELICDLCGTMLVTALKAKEHFIEHHEGLPPYKCFVCEKRLWSMHTRKEHMALHEDFSMLRNTYTCEKCNKTFAKKASLQEHLLRHTKAETSDFVKNELGQYPCKLCTEVFPTLNDVVTHFNDNHDKLGCHEDKTFRRLQVMICDLCGEKLVTGIKAKSHFVEKHNSLPPYSCSKCDKRFHSAYARNKHLLSHEENFHELRPKFPCQKCDKVFCSKFTLKKHMAVHLNQNENAEYSGEEDPEVVFEVRVEDEDTIEIVEPMESDLEPKPKNRRKGIYSSQQGDLDFSCVYCGSSFRYSHHLVTHMMKQHPEEEISPVEDEFKCICELCGAVLTELRVAEHFISRHGGASQSMCYICHKKLEGKEERALHLALHKAADM